LLQVKLLLDALTAKGGEATVLAAVEKVRSALLHRSSCHSEFDS
jgi:hypothetical protein